MSEQIAFRGRIFDLVQIPKPDGRVFEIARRAPGVRLIIPDRDKRQVLLTKEFRRELGEHDFRLPGGKVFETATDYETFRQSSGDITAEAQRQARVEAAEEAGIDIAELQLFRKSTLGATVEWDLYVFEATKWQPHPHGQQLKEDEPDDIVGVDFYDYSAVRQMIISGELQEDRLPSYCCNGLKDRYDQSGDI